MTTPEIVTTTNGPPPVPVNDSYLESQALSISDEAARIEIVDQASYTHACLFLRDTVAVMLRRVAEYFDDDIQKAHELHASLCEKRNRFRVPLKRDEQLVKQRIGAYEAEQRRLQEEQERLALAEAQRQVDESTEAVIEQVEASGGSADEVANIINQPIALARPIIQNSHQRVSGVISRKTYKGCVRSKTELVTAVLAGRAPWSLIEISQKTLDGFARQYGPELAHFVPGTVAIEDTTISTRRK